MSVKITGVRGFSPAFFKGIRAGDTLVSVNGNAIDDILDYRFHTGEKRLAVEYVNSRGKTRKCVFHIDSDPDETGLEFGTYLMDSQKSCKNKCIFCFIDQLPRGMRESLYFKDDDSRLSFLFGNYITLTNLTEREAERIVKMHISPVNVSVHTMNPELRVKMMANPKAGEALKYLDVFSEAGIAINAQLVLCPEINDGEELEYSLEKLAGLGSVQSVAAVPVGLTKYRGGLYPLKPYGKESAGRVIDIIDAFNARRAVAGLEPLAFPSDEFFQLAGRDIPSPEYYCGYPQLDNGVGLIASTREDFMSCLSGDGSDGLYCRAAIATGKAAFPLISALAEAFCEKHKNADIKVYEIENRFFGPGVTVAGLITGKDMISQLNGAGFDYPVLIIPRVMLRSDDDTVFLDDVTVDELGSALGAEIVVSSAGGDGLFDTLKGLLS